MQRQYFVYILASKRNGTLYTGVTNDLTRRVAEHKQGGTDGFAKKYHVHMLVYYEIFDNPLNAIQCEKQLKAGSRKKKLMLIEGMNPDWKDLSQSS